MQFIQPLEDMKSQIIVKGSDLELRKIAEESGNEELNSEESKQIVADFMRLFQKEHGIE